MAYITSIERLANEEGMQQGRLAGKVQLLTRILARRFGELPVWANDRILHADENTLDVWTEAVLSADSLTSVLGRD